MGAEWGVAAPRCSWRWDRSSGPLGPAPASAGQGHRQAAAATQPGPWPPLFPASQAAEATGRGRGSLALCSQGLRAMFCLFAGPPFPRLEGEGLGLSRPQHQRTPRTAARTSRCSKAKKTPPRPGPCREAPPGVGRGKSAAGQDARQGQPSGGQSRRWGGGRWRPSTPAATQHSPKGTGGCRQVRASAGSTQAQSCSLLSPPWQQVLTRLPPATGSSPPP